MIAYIYAGIKKQKMIDNNRASYSKALTIDSLTIIVYTVFMFTLVAALIIFKLLDRKYHLNLKMPTLLLTLLLCTMAVLIGVF